MEGHLMNMTENDTMTVRKEPLVDDATLDRLMAQIDAEGLELLGPQGVLTELTSRIMNRALEAERTDHLGYEAGDPAGRGAENIRNGYSDKTVLTDAGAVTIARRPLPFSCSPSVLSRAAPVPSSESVMDSPNTLVSDDRKLKPTMGVIEVMRLPWA
jgi:hypothetical protein